MILVIVYVMKISFTVNASHSHLGNYMLPFRRDCTKVTDPCDVQNSVPDSELRDINYIISEGEVNQAIRISPGIPTPINSEQTPGHCIKCQSSTSVDKLMKHHSTSVLFTQELNLH